jgi:osmotically inducible protein OsmC
MRGKPGFAHFAAAKAGLRMIAQSMAREYGPLGIHVAHVVIDGGIEGDRLLSRMPNLTAERGEDGLLGIDAIADTYWTIHKQKRSAWTQEVDLRPSRNLFETTRPLDRRARAFQDKFHAQLPRALRASQNFGEALVRIASAASHCLVFTKKEVSMIRKAKAVWRGTGRDGNGDLSTDSGVLASTPYSFKTRFENEKGTNPEELIAAAHAGCFTMALAFGLQMAGFNPTEISTEAAVSLEPEGKGFKISRSALTLRAKVPDLDEAKFAELAKDAEKNCPVSKVLSADITLDAKLA